MKAGLLAAALFLPLGGCERIVDWIGEQPQLRPESTRLILGADAEAGRRLIEDGRYGCHACHVIPGIRKARGRAGPPLDGMRERAFIAGQLPNRPSLLVAFIADAPALAPRTGMPALGLTEPEARDVAAYLYAAGNGR